jgi:hypothetical protein
LEYKVKYTIKNLSKITSERRAYQKIASVGSIKEDIYKGGDMGVFGKFFEKTSISKEPTWVDSERNCSWTEISSNESQKIEFGPESCYQDHSGTYIILRIFFPTEDQFLFAGCLIKKHQSDAVHVFLARVESTNGDVIKPDHTDPNRYLHVEKNPEVDKIITVANNYARFNNYSTVPFWVFQLKLMM